MANEAQFLDLVAEKFGTSRKTGETDDALRKRLEQPHMHVSISMSPTWPPAVLERLKEACRVIDNARIGGYFDKWLNTPGHLLARLTHCATAATALLGDPCLEVRMVERRDGPMLELQPRWEGWRVEPAG